jgi:hypothetical protein
MDKSRKLLFKSSLAISAKMYCNGDPQGRGPVSLRGIRRFERSPQRYLRRDLRFLIPSRPISFTFSANN